MRSIAALFVLCLCVHGGFATPVTVPRVTAQHGMVVAAHPEAAAIGVEILQAGGNAMDAAVATSLALGVAEPYGSGLGGKLMLLYYEAKSGRTYAVDAMDAAGSLDVPNYIKRPTADRSYGYGSVCVPGLAAGLWTAHQKWGQKKWAENVQPAIGLARKGFRVLPKSRVFFEEQEAKLRRGDVEIARLYLPQGELPAVGSLLSNEDLALTMEVLARKGRDGFYRGVVAERIVAASRQGGGVLTLPDLANYEARVTAPLTMDFRGYQLLCSPPPTSGAVFFLPILKVFERDSFPGGVLRTAENLDRIGRVWRLVAPQVWSIVADTPQSPFLVEKLLAPDSIAALRAKAFPPLQQRKVASASFAPSKKVTLPADASTGEAWSSEAWYESAMAATTHFIVVDAHGNIACATQSQSLHFGAGVVPPGTGVVLNDSMSNFSFSDSKSLNYVAPGKRSRSTIAPTLVLRGGKPVLAIGIPGAARIPSALLQTLLDRLVLDRPLDEAIGDTRIHFVASARLDEVDTIEAEQSFPAGEKAGLVERGWKLALPEPAGTGRHFGGINAIEISPDGTRTGYADPRRTNAAMGY